MRAFLEKTYEENLNREGVLKLLVGGLMEVVESSKNIEITMMGKDCKAVQVDETEIEEIVKQI